MKKIFSVVVTIVFLLTPCVFGGCGMKLFYEDDQTVAYNTFEQILYTVEQKDIESLATLFSKNVHEQTNTLGMQAIEFMDFISGDIISDNSGLEDGRAAYTNFDKGKIKKEIQFSFCLKTTKNKYYIAVSKCTVDTFDKDNVGITSIYIINAEDWTDEYVYRGDGEWTLGINIVNG